VSEAEGPDLLALKAQVMHDEILRLRVRVDTAEAEIKGLREARHDHAGKITTLLVAVEVIRRQLEELKPIPGDVEQIKLRVAELEVGVRGVREELSSVLTKLGEMETIMNEQAPKLRELERRLALKDVIALIVIQVLSYLVQRHLT
jgi:chromosome segregation ATPase